MRLSPAHGEAIRTAVLTRDPAAAVYLYGSRVDDEMKGGDIDLLVLSDCLGLGDKLDLLVTIKLAIGDQRIDLLIRPLRRHLEDPFVATILPSAQRL